MPQSVPGFYKEGRYALNEDEEVVLVSPTFPPVLAIPSDDLDQKVYLYGTNANFGDSLDARVADGMFVGSQLAFNTTIQGGMFEAGVLTFPYNTPTQPITLQQTVAKYVGDTLDEYYICTSSVPEVFTGYAVNGYYLNGVPQNQTSAVAIAIDGANNEYYDYTVNPPELANGMYVGNTLIAGAGYYVNGAKQTTETPQVSKINNLYYTAESTEEAPALFTGYVTLNNLFYDIHEGVADLFTGYTTAGYFEEGVGPSAKNVVVSPIEETGLADRGYYDYRTLPPQRAHGVYAGEGLLEGEGRYSNGGLLSNTKKTPIQSKIDDLYYTTTSGDPELFTGYAIEGYFEEGVGPSARTVVAEAFDGYGLYYDYRTLPPVKAQGLYTLKEDIFTSGEGFYIAGVKRASRSHPTLSIIDNEYYLVANYIPSLFTGYYRTGYIDPVDYPLLSERNAVATPIDGDAFVHLDYNTVPPTTARGLYTAGGSSTLIEGEGFYSGGGFKRQTRTYPIVSNSNGLYYTVVDYVPTLFTGYLVAGYITDGDITTATTRSAVAAAADRWWRNERYYDYRVSPPKRANGFYTSSQVAEGAGYYNTGVRIENSSIPVKLKGDNLYYIVSNYNLVLFTGYSINGYISQGVVYAKYAVAAVAENGLYYDHTTLPSSLASGLYYDSNPTFFEGFGVYDQGVKRTTELLDPMESNLDGKRYTMTFDQSSQSFVFNLFTGYIIAGYFVNGVKTTSRAVFAPAATNGLHLDYTIPFVTLAYGLYYTSNEPSFIGFGIYDAGVKRTTELLDPMESKLDGKWYTMTFNQSSQSFVFNLFTGYATSGYFVNGVKITSRAVLSPNFSNGLYYDYRNIIPALASGLYYDPNEPSFVGFGVYNAGVKRTTELLTPTLSVLNGKYYIMTFDQASQAFVFNSGIFINNDNGLYYDYTKNTPELATGLYYSAQQSANIIGAGLYSQGVKLTSSLSYPLKSKIDNLYYNPIINSVTGALEPTPATVNPSEWLPFGPSKYWGTIAMSQTGQRQTATVSYEKVYVSSDFGRTWTQKLFDGYWSSSAMTPDGSIQLVSAFFNGAHLSSDYGSTWTQKVFAGTIVGVAMTTDGQKQFAMPSGERRFYVSYDYGNTWTTITPSVTINPAVIRISDDASKIILYEAASPNRQLVFSEDSGATWQSRGFSGVWGISRLSPDGNMFIAVDSATKKMYKYTNFGRNHTQIGLGIDWAGSVNASADLSRILALSTSGLFHLSTNGGDDWLPVDKVRTWRDGTTVVSADGNRMALLVANAQIYHNI